jgi:cytochrome P450
VIDPSDPGFLADPYPTYAALRRAGPAVWHEETGQWLVARHRAVNAALRDRRLGRKFAPKEPRERFEPWNMVNEHSMLELEPPQHTRLRKLVAREFTPRRAEALRQRVRALADGLLDAVADANETDLIADFAEPFPVAVISELLGIPEADRHLLRPWSNAIVALYELRPAAGAAERAVAAAQEFGSYLRQLAAERRHRPGTDLFSALAVLSLQGDRLTENELVATAVLLLNAGHEASVNVIGNGVLALLRHPAEWDRVVTDPGLVPKATEEMIRYDTPLSLFQRTAFEDIDIGGQVIARGQRIGLLLGSANRDPEAFERPDTFDAGRGENPHVGFGAGIHFCLGAPLARVEAQEALRSLVRRFPRLSLAEEPAIRPTFQFRGYQSLRVRTQPLG